MFYAYSNLTCSLKRCGVSRPARWACLSSHVANPFTISPAMMIWHSCSLRRPELHFLTAVDSTTIWQPLKTNEIWFCLKHTAGLILNLAHMHTVTHTHSWKHTTPPLLRQTQTHTHTPYEAFYLKHLLILKRKPFCQQGVFVHAARPLWISEGLRAFLQTQWRGWCWGITSQASKHFATWK